MSVIRIKVRRPVQSVQVVLLPEVLRGPTLSAEQQAVVEAPLDRALRVLAGPGAGKTMVQIARHLRLIDLGLRPESILAVTLTKSMAVDYRRRLIASRPGLDEMFGEAMCQRMGTIHSVSWGLLKDSGDPRHAVAEPAVVDRLIHELAACFLPQSMELGADQTPEQLVKLWLRNAKSLAVDGENAAEFYARHMPQHLPGGVASAMARILAEFNGRLRADGLITFPDMLSELEIRLQRDPAFLKRWQEQIHFVLIDEAQDAAAQPMRILTRLAWPQNQLMLVGDGDQTLFRFLGAAPEHNLYDHFENHFPDGLTFQLNTNYRSTAAIVAAQNRLIRHNYQSGGGSTPDRYRKTLTPRPGAQPGVKLTFRLYPNASAEAAGVAAQCYELIKSRTARPQEIFVGARMRRQLAEMELALATRGIPCVNLCGGSFWSLPHIQKLVDYLALAVDTEDDEAFQRVYNTATALMRHGRQLGPQFLKACGGRYAGIEAALADDVRRRTWLAGVRDLQGFVAEIQALLAGGAPAAQALAFIRDRLPRTEQEADGLGKLEEATEDPQGEVETLLEIAGQYPAPADLIAHVRKMQRRTGNARRNQVVVLSTIHKLKGQERPYIFGIGWCEADGGTHPAGLLPHGRSLQAALAGDEHAIEDERCLGFVLISRAKVECRLSAPAYHFDRDMRPSRFIRELGLKDEGEN